MDKSEAAYMTTLDRLLLDYLHAGVPAVGLVPESIMRAAMEDRPVYALVFRKGGELYNNCGPESAHYATLAAIVRKSGR